MTNKHITRARVYQQQGIDSEQQREYEEAISFYQMSMNRWRKVRKLDMANWCRCRISQCESMMLAGDTNG